MPRRLKIASRGGPDPVTDGSPAGRNAVRTLVNMLPRLWPEGRADLRARVVFALLALVAAKGVTVYVPFLYKYAVDALSPETVAAAAVVVPVMLIVGYGVGRILMIALAQLRDAIFAKVGQNAVRELAVETFRHLHALSLRFHLERRTGGLSRVIERGTKGIDFLLRFSLFNIVPTIIELVLVCFILAYAFDIWYSVVTAVTVIVYMVFTFAVTEWRTRFRREMNDLDTEANTKAVDSLLNYETVKYFGNEEHETRRFDRSMTGYERAAIRTATSLSLLNTGQTLIFSTGLTLLMLMAANGIAQGALTVGSFVMINTYLIQLYQPLNLLGTVYREIRQALIDMETMFDLLQVPAEIKDKPGAPALEVSGGEIVFDDVKFYYDSDRRILDGVSFHVPAGGTLAIVGPSGAGKSTIGRILFRFYDISEGAVRIDGQDIRDVRQDSLRAVIGMVPQDTVLFNDTIRYNIRYGRPDATDEEVREAAELAQIGRFIESLPQGYETRVGERGLKLSGGEKQRVAIARTILKNPPILLLDEATSALDTHTEKEIQTALKGISRNRTTLVIAHRLSTVVDADEILVLDAGRVIERGRHEDLLSRDGAYAAMWNRQRESEEAELEEERLFAASKEAEEPQEKERTPVSADSGFA
ncbi:ABC transporter ATP-binding protein/permease [Parvibaculum sp.]|uniref:ABCB family ABC transporter ATP-binding protein/permease n=2 Tax=Parvibaculum sp. TaxID=2024848 RepID=UPI001B28407A|nr:ABC transporter ATP-binding protein/permease [Parvibaculum sp.]MBO6667312.1 ABC transporter ATP-binding protein/permease [Parvibaculum sp.]MBO6691441.1 ABC transporter ATP-binding protein/permease [Parvibaculum sp.]MBO6713864.1 ABC transporter ATP-binding protein/permease [Parvibaculum sp.]